jgi:hypothetical protein
MRIAHAILLSNRLARASKSQKFIGGADIRPNGLRCGSTVSMQRGMVDHEEISQRVATLKIEHRDLDDAISVLSQSAAPDLMQIARLKKRKLRLRDEIIWWEDQLLPDIIA